MLVTEDDRQRRLCVQVSSARLVRFGKAVAAPGEIEFASRSAETVDAWQPVHRQPWPAALDPEIEHDIQRDPKTGCDASRLVRIPADIRLRLRTGRP